MKSVEVSELMIVASVAFIEEAELNSYDARTESLGAWVNRMGVEFCQEVADKAIDKLSQPNLTNKQLEKLEDEYNTKTEEERIGVAMIRDDLNLPCFQVDWGNF